MVVKNMFIMVKVGFVFIFLIHVIKGRICLTGLILLLPIFVVPNLRGIYCCKMATVKLTSSDGMEFPGVSVAVARSSKVIASTFQNDELDLEEEKTIEIGQVTGRQITGRVLKLFLDWANFHQVTATTNSGFKVIN